MALRLNDVARIVTQYETEIDIATSTRSLNANPFLERLTLQKIQHDLPRLLRTVNEHKSSKGFLLLHARLQRLSATVDESFHEQKQASEVYLDRYRKERVSASAEAPIELSVSDSDNDHSQNTGDNYASLRKRLLADGATTSLDNRSRSREQMNNYHETLQEDLLSDLTDLATSLMNSARTLSARIVDDAHLVSGTGENMMKSLTLMLSVGTNLNAYLSEKTGGKITLFFMIKTMAFVFVLFFVMVVLTKVLPKM